MGSILSSTPSTRKHQSTHTRSVYGVHFDLADSSDVSNDRNSNEAYNSDYLANDNEDWNVKLLQKNGTKAGTHTHRDSKNKYGDIVQNTSIPSTPFHRRLGVPSLGTRIKISSATSASQRHSIHLHHDNHNELICGAIRNQPILCSSESLKGKLLTSVENSVHSGRTVDRMHGCNGKSSSTCGEVEHTLPRESCQIVHIDRVKPDSCHYACSQESNLVGPYNKPMKPENLILKRNTTLGTRPNALYRPGINRRVHFDQKRQFSEPATCLQHSNSYCSSLDQPPISSGQQVDHVPTIPCSSYLNWHQIDSPVSHFNALEIHSNSELQFSDTMSSLHTRSDYHAPSRHTHTSLVSSRNSTSSTLLVPCECSRKCLSANKHSSDAALSHHQSATTTNYLDIAHGNHYFRNQLPVIARLVPADIINQFNQRPMSSSPYLSTNQYYYHANEHPNHNDNTQDTLDLPTSLIDSRPSKEISRYKIFTKSISCYALKLFHQQQGQLRSKMHSSREVSDLAADDNQESLLRKTSIPKLRVSQIERHTSDATKLSATYQQRRQSDICSRKGMSANTATDDIRSSWYFTIHSNESTIINHTDAHSDIMHRSDIQYRTVCSPKVMPSVIKSYGIEGDCSKRIYADTVRFPMLFEPTNYWAAKFASDRDISRKGNLIADIRRNIFRANTNEMLKCLANFVISRLYNDSTRSVTGQCTRGVGFHSLQSSSIVRWIKSIDRALLVQGWSDVTFINPVHTIFLFMMLKECVEPEVNSELELHTIVMACLYLSYAYMGNEISYPLKPFLVAETNQLLRYNQTSSKRLMDNGKVAIGGYESSVRGKVIEQVRNRFWQYCLRLVNAKSADMQAINADPMFFSALFWELKSYGSLVFNHSMPS